MRIIILSIFLSGCANMPTEYGQSVIILEGLYKDYYGTLIGDCSGFENYKVYIPRKKINVCIRSWDLEGL